MLMLVRLLQLENAPFPMLVTLSGMLMPVRLLHHENASSPMLVTVCPSSASGMDRVFSSPV